MRKQSTKTKKRRKPGPPVVKITTRQVVKLTGRSMGRLSQLRDELPPLRERTATRGREKLYDRAQVLAWLKENPTNRTKQRAGRLRYAKQ